jgi:CheY-specific phosphatase CheX
MSKVPLTEWVEALVVAANELATGSLGFEEGSVVGTESSLSSVVSGSLVALVGQQSSVEVGICATKDNCVKLARSFLGMEPEDEELSSSDLDDALGEMANVLAGVLKSQLNGRVPPLQLGLPIVLHGLVGASSSAEMVVAKLQWEEAEAHFLLIRNAMGE